MQPCALFAEPVYDPFLLLALIPFALCCTSMTRFFCGTDSL